MEEQNKNEELIPTPEEVLVQMQETMVPKEEAEKWHERYNKLFKSVANGTFKPQEQEIDWDKQTKDLLAGLYNGTITGAYNRAKALQQIDDNFEAAGRGSIFGKAETDEQRYNLKRFREYHKYAVENCDGDDKMFAALISKGLS